MGRKMINYYYEIQDDVTVFGHRQKYLAYFDVHPGLDNGGINWKFHDDAVKCSRRVWLENANGISLIKGPMSELAQERVDEHQLVWLKLICKDIALL
jgi:hypothetical protein